MFQRCAAASNFLHITHGTFIGLTALVLAVACPAANASPAVSTPKAKPCAVTDLTFDGATDMQALVLSRDAARELLRQGRYGDLDCLADAARSGKTKFSGGFWKIHNLYWGLSEPTSGHATDEDWRDHLERLDKWVAANPDSVTARVALAKSYTGYAWFARGDGYSDSVSDSGWRLFQERTAKAKDTLDSAAKLTTKCPEWYVAMLEVALAEGWDLPEASSLFREAVAYAPDYYYYYRMRANYLLPKWYGEDGDSERFTAESADQLGGDAGDILYFQVASQLTCTCEDPQFKNMAWPRIQRGYAALEKQSGQSLVNVNSMALMAVKALDAELAESLFQRIGDNWDEQTWHSEKYFKQCRDWAHEIGPFDAHVHAVEREIKANLATPEGAAYRNALDQKLGDLEQQCLKSAAGDTEKAELWIQVGKEGRPQQLMMPRNTKTTLCLFTGVGNTRPADASPILPLPPHALYWMSIELDPTQLSMSK